MGRETRSTWQTRVERWSESGLTAAEFAAEIGVNARTLTYWKWKLGSERSGEKRGQKRHRSEIAPTFVEVVPRPVSVAPPEVSPSDAIEVVLDSGIRVRVPARFDAEALRRVVAALGAR